MTHFSRRVFCQNRGGPLPPPGANRRRHAGRTFVYCTRIILYTTAVRILSITVRVCGGIILDIV